jgi:enoyl-CoA hydratase
MTNKLATVSFRDEVTIITLDDGKANVFSPAMIKEVHNCLDKVPTESGSLIIAGRDGMFSGGFDLKIISSGDMKAIQEMSLGGFRLLSRILSFPRPVIAACSGHGIALGTFLLCCCDYRLGAKGNYMVGANEMRTNMVIPTPILELIRFRVSQTHKYRAILGAEMYSIEAAVDAGLIDEAIDEKNLMEAAMLKAKDLATMGHPSYTLTKELFIS